MSIHPITTVFLLICSGVALQSATAAECVFKAIVPDTRVVKDSGEIYDPQDWLVDGQCERLRVVTGKVRVVARDADGLPERREVSGGRLAAKTTGSGSAVFDSMLSMIAGDIRTKAGRSRSGSAGFEAVDAALPRGNVVKPDGDLLITLPTFADEAGGTFVLTESGKPVHQTRLVVNSLSIPGKVLRAGATYAWHFKTRFDESRGSFSIVTPAAYEAALQGGDGPITRIEDRLAAAGRLQAAGYNLESRRMLRAWLDE